MQLIIVESPTKARTLSKFLKGEYRVEATMGHVRDLPKAALGVDIEHDFAPKYIVPRAKAKQTSALVDTAKKADQIILATDPDREGEAIAWHVAELLAISNQSSAVSKRKKAGSGKPVLPAGGLKAKSLQRIVFHEITEHAIAEALAHPRQIDLPLVDAQQARRVLDRLVGYKLSPLLWQKLSKRWLSAGRVQSVAVRLIVEREREITGFVSQEYWTIEGIFAPAEVANGNLDPSSVTSRNRVYPSISKPSLGSEAGQNFVGSPQSQPIAAQLVSKDGVKYEQILTYTLFDGKYSTTSSTIRDKQQATSIMEDLKAPFTQHRGNGAGFTVSAVDKKEVKRYPYPPYTTSTLQQDAGRRLYFSAKRTMQLAQKLYEEGFITYHRTDSVNLAEKFIGEARGFIAQTYGADYVPSEARRYKTKSKVAQEAHEAIRPTDVNVTSDKLQGASELNHDHVRLYELIWKRALAAQAAEAVFDSTTIDITSANGYQFETQGSVIKFEGFLKITGRENGEVVVPDVAVGQALALAQATPTQHMTSPPPRYTEASLVKTLEEKGIGRPSTYAPIISTIQERQYVIREEKKLVPTELGNAVTDFLVKYFPDIMALPFTAQLEDDLDAIANGQKEWVPVIRAFYEPFAKDLAATYDAAEKVKLVEEQLDEACPKCGSGLVVRMGRYGKFVACSTFPVCDYTRQFAEKIDRKCPRCGGDIVIKKSKRGKTFYGCSNYPTCTFAAWKKEDIK